jgi:hypothetical protein
MDDTLATGIACDQLSDYGPADGQPPADIHARSSGSAMAAVACQPCFGTKRSSFEGPMFTRV